jgi:hypothetical protein
MAEDKKYIERIAALITAHIRGTLSEEETVELKEWCAMSVANQALFDELSGPECVERTTSDLPDMEALRAEGWNRIAALL